MHHVSLCIRALGRKTYACTIGEVAQQREQEEQQRQSFTGPLSLILDDLRYSCTKIAHRTDVPQNLSSHRCGVTTTRMSTFFRRRSPDITLPRDCPTGSTSGTHQENTDRVLEPCPCTALFFNDGSQTRSAPASTAPPPCLAARQT